MKRFWRFTSEAAQSSTIFIIKRRRINTLQHPPSVVIDIFSLFKASIPSHKNQVAVLRNKLLLVASDSVTVTTILNDNVQSLISSRPLFLALLNQFNSHPSLLLQVFNWRRKRKVSESDTCWNSMDAHEYSKGIKAAGRCKNIDLAIELFKEAENKGVKISSTYNALMGAFMFNGLADRCHSLFLDMKKDPICTPNNVTYNIVISVFGRVMRIDDMEATFKEMRELHLSPNISTYNYLIAGYISSWMWDGMEKVFQVLKSGPVEPNMKTYLLMIRGYAHCGNLEKMEEIYSLVRDYVNENEMSIIRVMICGYCKSSDADKVKKVEALLKLIPEKEYRPWLNALLIKLYAQENRLEEMENAINEAFEHKAAITTLGWRICHSLFHCKLVMYGSQNNFREMQNVLEEMEDIDVNCNKRTLWIMYKAYSSSGQRSMVLKILGKMFKHGYEIPDDAFPS
ncbi:pentatricopeptide repeat-containing protein [Trifolium repens]|nr:pentatricopeptide repeat-containing protein [Trifolium repens]